MQAYIVTTENADIAPVLEREPGLCLIYFYGAGVKNKHFENPPENTSARIAYCPTSAQMYGVDIPPLLEELTLVRWFSELNSAKSLRQLA